MGNRVTAFLVNLLQDVNIIRPLVYLSAIKLQQKVIILFSHRFTELDTSGVWMRELETLRQTVGASLVLFESPYAMRRELDGLNGFLIAASESHIHKLTHEALLSAPNSFLKITLQHGFECVGFLHNTAHDRSHGRTINFASDVICGWGEISNMVSVSSAERNKYIATGPTSLIPGNSLEKKEHYNNGLLICENLHSVRFSTHGNSKQSFIKIFSDFCADISHLGDPVVLRPHPGGQFVIKNGLPLPEGVTLNNTPIYRTDLTRFRLGISAPSSIILDLVLANVPVAVWQDEGGEMSLSNYAGLTVVRNCSEWSDFVKNVTCEKEHFLRLQKRFLNRSGLIVDPLEVERRFERLLNARDEEACKRRLKSAAGGAEWRGGRKVRHLQIKQEDVARYGTMGRNTP